MVKKTWAAREKEAVYAKESPQINKNKGKNSIKFSISKVNRLEKEFARWTSISAHKFPLLGGDLSTSQS